MAMNYFKQLNLKLRYWKSNLKGIYILMYHRVNDQLEASELVVSVQTFKEQMQYLKENCTVLSFNELIKIYERPKDQIMNSRQPQVVITIDDGYQDTYLNAFPVLKELQLPATIFAITGMISTNLKIARYNDMPEPDMLTWEQLDEMRHKKILVCSHTDTHPFLTKLDYAAQLDEIKKARDILFARYGDQVIHDAFAYTYGEYNQETLKIMANLHFKIGLTCEQGINAGNVHPFELKRIHANGNDSLEQFAEKFIRFAYN